MFDQFKVPSLAPKSSLGEDAAPPVQFPKHTAPQYSFSLSVDA